MNPMIAFSMGLLLPPQHALGLLFLSLLPPGPSYISLRAHDVDRVQIEDVVSVCTVLALGWLPVVYHVASSVFFVVDNNTGDVAAAIRLTAVMGLSIGPFGLGIALKAHKASKFKVVSAVNTAGGTLLALGVVINKLTLDPSGAVMARGIGPVAIIMALGAQFVWAAVAAVVARMAFAPEDSGWHGPTPIEIQRREGVQFSCAVQNLPLGVLPCPSSASHAEYKPCLPPPWNTTVRAAFTAHSVIQAAVPLARSA
jgi:hypothetical protein